MDTKDMTGSAWLPAFEAQRPATPGAVAHMSLHLNQRCQRATRQNLADNQCSPIFSTGGLGVRLCWRPVEEEAKPPFPAGEGAYMEGVPARQRDFAFFLKQVAKPPETRDFAFVAGPLGIAIKPNRLPESFGITLNPARLGIVSKTLIALGLVQIRHDRRFSQRAPASGNARR